MAAKKRGLGRGLDALLGDNLEVDSQAAAAAGELREVALGALRPGRYQPRNEIDPDALESLAQSIRAQGVVQPLVVQADGDGYEIVAGERRWRAAGMAGLDVVPVVVRDIPDSVAMAVALIENIQREDLNPLDEAHALQRLIAECGLTHAACAQAVGRSRASVSNLLRLLDLAHALQTLLRSGQINMGHARALLGAPQAMQAQLGEKVVARGLSVRQTEALVQAALQHDKPARSKGVTQSPRVAQMEQELGDLLKARVAIRQAKNGRARVVIDYKTAADLDALLARLK